MNFVKKNCADAKAHLGFLLGILLLLFQLCQEPAQLAVKPFLQNYLFFVKLAPCIILRHFR